MHAAQNELCSAANEERTNASDVADDLVPKPVEEKIRGRRPTVRKQER